MVFFSIGGRGHYNTAIAWLVGASLFFYGWWNPAYLGLIIGSIIFNYLVGLALGKCHEKAVTGYSPWHKPLMVLGVAANLSLIGYYKYANFSVDNFNRITGSSYHLDTIILPLAISFFTFQQIAYVVDAYKGKTRELNFLRYSLFVTFFPQLIAGPIVYHEEILPQYAKKKTYKLSYEHMAVGLTIFFIGLFKKAVLADGIMVYATPFFNAVEQGVALTFFEAWVGALAYTFQLYFDFSGYSDMAIGLARMFGIRLPLNFYSPYKAINIIDFWRRWHITLTRFLRNYLYIPLGGNRKGNSRRYLNMMITMLLGGLWHGAGWTFVVWGGLHGIYLTINHGWHNIRRALGHDLNQSSWWGRGLSYIITFLAVVVSWVFFRSESFVGAKSILWSMAGMNGISLPKSLAGRIGVQETWLLDWGISFTGMFSNGIVLEPNVGIYWLVFLFVVAIAAPNTHQFMLHFKPAFEIYHDKGIQITRGVSLKYSISVFWAVVFSMLSMYSIVNISTASEFLYFNF
jgi:D-alanyl-lipoteichoic acid acyltransferase DltB (MBOAT superfamily)